MGLNVREKIIKGKTYYALYDGNKFVKHIGNAEKLKVFQRDIQIGQEAAEFLKQRPYLNPKASLGIIASGKKDLVGKVPLPDKQYRTIVIDPPWPIEKIPREVRPNQVEVDYPVMFLDEIRGLPIPALTTENCHLYLWTTQRFLPDAFDCIGVWGFHYIFTMVWHKPGGFQPYGLPQYNCEFILFGRKGNLPFETTQGFSCCFEAPRREHSRKPDEFYDLVHRVSPGPRLDMFSREVHEGFESWGNETAKFSG